MKSNLARSFLPAIVILVAAILACNMPGGVVTSVSPPREEETTQIAVVAEPVNPTPTLTATVAAQPADITPTATVAAAITHIMTPTGPRSGKVIYDVQSAGTASERRAPYGDSFDWNRLERPFLQDMTYVSDLDIVSFTVAGDNDWWYVSMELTGVDPNNALGINYGIELDINRDGFGDYLIWTHPPYTTQWDTVPVQIFQDNNRNTSGLSAGKSDAPFSADGYESLIFDGSVGGSDPDMAWVRIHAGVNATVQLAFKKSWSGTVFMLGVIADAGWKDPTKLDYVDRISISEAGSPVKNNSNYPLKALFSVDNTCREAFGFEPTYYEPQICPVEPTPTKKPREPKSDPQGPTPVPGCQPPPGGCLAGSKWDSGKCTCVTTIY